MLFEGFTQLAALMAVAVVVGALAITLRQPLIVGFIGVGILVGPTGFDWVGESENIELLAKLGIAVLLFLVGLKLDPRHVRSTGPVALATGLGQVLFTSVFGYLIALALGFDQVSAVYVAVALTFSSTIIIVKLLSDKRELDDLHGRIAVGFLIVQDIVVVIALIVITALGAAGAADDVGTQLGGVLLRGFAFVAALIVITRWVLPLILGRLARNRELLILFGVAWALAAATVGDELGLSTEVGAFLAGFTLAGTPYREAIASRLVSLRDFLLLFFFIDLGSQLQLGLVGETIGPALVFSLFVLVGNPVIVLVIMGLMGYRKRTSFLAGLTVAQISEFSLILVALGLRVGHVDESVLGLVTTVGVITIGLSTYLIIYSQPIFDRLSPFLSIFERKKAASEIHPDQEGDIDAIVYGIGRHGSIIVKSLQEAGWEVMAVDVDPDGLRSATDLGCAVVYGDAEDPEFPLSLPLEQARWVVSTVPNGDINVSLLHALRASGYEGKVALTAHNPGDVERFHAEHVDIVISPFSVAAERLVSSLIDDHGQPTD